METLAEACSGACPCAGSLRAGGGAVGTCGAEKLLAWNGEPT